MLHPHHKLQYFQHAGWKADWITTAKKIVQNEFDSTYRFQDDVVEATEPEATNKTAKNIFDSLPAFHLPPTNGAFDDLTHYLANMPKDVKNEDVLTWWYERKHVYPQLYRMALDYHTVPGK